MTNQAIEDLIKKYTIDDISTLDANELKYIAAKNLGMTGISKTKKADLIEKITAIYSEYIDEKRKKAKEQLPESGSFIEIRTHLERQFFIDNSIDNARKIANHFKDLLLIKPDKDGNYDEDIPNEYRSNSISGYTLSTLGKTFPKEIRQICRTLTDLYPQSDEFVRAFHKEIYANWLQKIERICNAKYTQKINRVKYLEDARVIDGEKVLNWAKKIIDVACYVDKEVYRDWYELSLALAITSGRRMDELHGQSVHRKRFFELRENGQIYISQLAKCPDGNDFIFTPLIDSHSWIHAHSLLPLHATNKMDDEVNKTIASSLSRHLRKVYKELNFECYKDSRDFYIAYRVFNEYKKGESNTFSQSDFVQSIIGHNSKISGLSYEKFIIQ